MAHEGVKVFNPAFDVTSRELVTAIITERGVVRPPFSSGLRKIFE
jgi:methylthioribose-1-phosphate isomerase